MSSLGRSRPATVMLSLVDEPIHVCTPWDGLSGAIDVDLLGRAFERQLVLGQPAGWRVRQLVQDLEVPRHLEASEQTAQEHAEPTDVDLGVARGDDEGLDSSSGGADGRGATGAPAQSGGPASG